MTNTIKRIIRRLVRASGWPFVLGFFCGGLLVWLLFNWFVF